MRMFSSSRWSWTHCVSTRTSLAYSPMEAPCRIPVGFREILSLEQSRHGGGHGRAPALALRRIDVDHLERDVPRRARGAGDQLTLLAPFERDGAARLVEQSPHGGVDELLAQHAQPAAVEVARVGGSHQPAHDGGADQRIHQRGDAIGIAHVRLGASGADGRGPGGVAGGAPHGMPGRDEIAGERLAAPPAANDQDTGHTAKRMPVIRITRFGFVNAFLVDEDDGLTLIDTLVPGGEKAILRAADDLAKPIVRIALTHAHMDHVGSLDKLAAAVPSAEVLISARDARLLGGDMSLDADEPQTKIRGGVPKNVSTRPTRTFSPGERLGSLEV